MNVKTIKDKLIEYENAEFLYRSVTDIYSSIKDRETDKQKTARQNYERIEKEFDDLIVQDFEYTSEKDFQIYLVYLEYIKFKKITQFNPERMLNYSISTNEATKLMASSGIAFYDLKTLLKIS